MGYISIELPSMNTKELSHLYYRATSRAVEEIVVLYEDLHDNKGEPLTDPDKVTTLTQACVQRIRYELELVKSSVAEHNGL